MTAPADPIISPAALAREVGVSVQAIYKWSRSRRHGPDGWPLGGQQGVSQAILSGGKREGVPRSLAYQLRDRGQSMIAQGLVRHSVSVEVDCGID